MRKGGKFILSILIPIEIYTSRTWITFRKLYESRSAKMEFSFLSRPPREVWKIYSVSRV